jgi:GWxTD domain-containing protein
MVLLGLLLLTAVETRGDLKMSLSQAVYPAESSDVMLELSYDIPYTSLAFLRGDSGYAARFKVGASLLDGRGNPVAGDVWFRTIATGDYSATVSRAERVLGTVTLGVPPDARSARVEVADLSSSRRASGSFKVEAPSSEVRLRFFLAGEQNPGRKYGLGDTIEVHAEVLAPDARPDSFRFGLRSGKRTLAGGTEPVMDTAGRRYARFRYAVADSAGRARLGTGEYQASADAVPESLGLAARQSFRVEVPFFYDDSAWTAKVEQLLWVADAGKMQDFKRLPSDERESAWKSFWRGLDQTPTTTRNEREEEYFERIEYAEENFRRGDKGYRSDRARVYVLLGPPESIESRPFELDSNAMEIWYYYSRGLTFVFVDRSGFGEYILESPRFWDER